MIHCLDDRDPEDEMPDIVIRVPLDDQGDYADAGINIRPHLRQTLIEANKNFQVVAFTASDQQYADAILDYLDPERALIQHRLYRQHCVETEFGFIKDLRVIANRDLKDIVLVDNSVLSFCLQVNNGIPILPFYSDSEDEELLHLLYYLSCLHAAADVRDHNSEAFSLMKLRELPLSQVLGEEEADEEEEGS